MLLISFTPQIYQPGYKFAPFCYYYIPFNQKDNMIEMSGDTLAIASEVSLEYLLFDYFNKLFLLNWLLNDLLGINLRK